MNFKIINKLTSDKSILFSDITDYSFFYGRLTSALNPIRLYYKPGIGHMVVSFSHEKGYWVLTADSIVEDYTPVDVTLTVERISTP